MRDKRSAHYYDKNHTLVLSMNSKLGYIGAELINIKDAEVMNSIFFQNAEEELREDIFSLTECKIASIVSEYLY